MAKSKNKANSKAKPKARKMQAFTSSNTGAYTLASNRPVIRRSSPPLLTPYQDGVRVRNTEQLLGAALTLTPGNTKGLVGMSPADAGAFPWLSRVVTNYAKYRFRKLILSYVPYVGTTQSGFVSAGSIYDAEDALKYFAGTTQFPLSSQPEYTIGPLYAGNSIRSHDDDVSSSNWLGIEFNCRRMSDNWTKWFYVDPSSTPALGEGNEARLNQTQPAYAAFAYSNGSAGNVVVGAWYATYEIEMIQPTSATIQ